MLYAMTKVDPCACCGTKYPCDQNILNALTHGPLAPRSISKMELGQVVAEMESLLKVSKSPSKLEFDAASRLGKAMQRFEDQMWGPDLVIKAFQDLDQAFFKGRLTGHVCICWKTEKNMSYTAFTEHRSLDGKSYILLNADRIILESKRKVKIFEAMWEITLHEMVVSASDAVLVSFLVLRIAD